MSEHLTKDELILIIQKQPQRLATNRTLHYSNCAYCRSRIVEQQSVHNILAHLKPLNAPAQIIQNVLGAVRLKPHVAKNGKIDWLFLMALVTLFVISISIVFSGNIEPGMASYLKQIFPDSETVVNTPILVDTLKKDILKLNIFDTVFKEISLRSSLFWGFLSFLFYLFVDKKFGHSYRIRKS